MDLDVMYQNTKVTLALRRFPIRGLIHEVWNSQVSFRISGCKYRVMFYPLPSIKLLFDFAKAQSQLIMWGNSTPMNGRASLEVQFSNIKMIIGISGKAK